MTQKSPKHYFLAIKNKLWLIILFTILFSVVGAIIVEYNRSKIAPDYVASTTVIVGGPNTYITEQKIDVERYEMVNKEAIVIFNNIVKSELLAHELITDLQLDMSYEVFEEKIQAEIIDKTNMLTLRVIDKNPRLAKEIVSEIITRSTKKLKKTNGIETVEALGNIRVRELPIKLRTKTNVKFFGVLGCLVSIFVVGMLEYFDSTIKLPEDLEKTLKLPILSIISSEAQAQEAYRMLRTNIYNFRTDKKYQTIVITSVDRNKNKSMVATNLAIAMSKIQQKVLLVDGDIREPKIHTSFKLDNEFGLSNILSDDIDFREMIQTTDKENLDVLTSGPRLANPAELLLSDKLELLFKELQKEYDIIIIDSHILGSMSDAMAFSICADGVILVSTVGVSDICDIEMNKKRLEELNASILGTALVGYQK